MKKRYIIPGALTTAAAESIFERFINSVNQSTDADIDEMFAEFLKKAIRYANVRAKWELYSAEEKRDEDEGRSLLHNSLISSVNILKRLLEKENLDISWREDLGEDRKIIGDFACFVVYRVGVSQR